MFQVHLLASDKDAVDMSGDVGVWCGVSRVVKGSRVCVFVFKQMCCEFCMLSAI